MPYEWFVAKRYIWSKRRHPFVGVISTISVLGIAVGVAALLVVLAVMNGFDEDLQNRIIGTRAHIVIEKDGVFDDAESVIQRLASVPGVAHLSPFVEGQALVQKNEAVTGVLVRGIDPARERNVSKFYDYLKEGSPSEVLAKEGGIVLGSELAKRLGLRPGAAVELVSQPKKKPSVFTVDGIFSSGMYEFDANLVFLNIADARDLLDLKNGASSGISVAIGDPSRARAVKKRIREALGYPYFARTWMEMNRTLFGALKLEKTVMFLILALIILVACLNIAGSLTILVMDKTKDIGVLKALGATPFSLMKIFALDGLLIGALGALSGFLAGSGICFLLKKYSFVELPKEIYYLDKLPVRMNAADSAWVLAVAVILSFVSAFYPAVMAGRLDPVKALRYE